jgi:hypothetical protein
MGEHMNDHVIFFSLSASNLTDLPLDTLTLICSYLRMKDACCLYRTGCSEMIEAIANTKFDFFKYDAIPYDVSVKQFRTVFKSAIGIIVSPDNLTDEDFDYMVPRNQFGKPIGEIRINMSKRWRHDWMLPGLPPRRKYGRNAFKKLQGIHSLVITNNHHIRYRDFKSLKGITFLDMTNCNQIPPDAFKHLTGIKHLILDGCTMLNNDVLKYLKGIKVLSVINCTEITTEAYEELFDICLLYPLHYGYEDDDDNFWNDDDDDELMWHE